MSLCGIHLLQSERENYRKFHNRAHISPGAKKKKGKPALSARVTLLESEALRIIAAALQNACERQVQIFGKIHGEVRGDGAVAGGP